MHRAAEPGLLTRFASRVGRDPEALASVGIAEELRLVEEFLDYGGVRIDLLDLSSRVHTGTFKAHLAAIAVSDLRRDGAPGFVTASSGNTAQAMATYAAPHKLSGFLFVPESSRYKLNRDWIELPSLHLFLLDVAEPIVKQIAAEFSRHSGLPLAPNLEHQLDANKIRAFFLAEQHRQGVGGYDWTVQALSGGFGPLGFYAGMKDLILEGELDADLAPSFLGVQQEAVCPFIRPVDAKQGGPKVPLLEPTLYATRPSHARELRDVVDEFGGAFTMVSNASYERREPELLELLAARQIHCGRADYLPRRPLIERSGLLAIVGAMEAVDRGIVARGGRVLVCFTGGCSPDLTSPVEPDLMLGASDPLAPFWEEIAGLLPPRAIRAMESEMGKA